MVIQPNKLTAEEIDKNKLFDNFVQAQTCVQTTGAFGELCRATQLEYPPPAHQHCTFYPRLKKRLAASWRAETLFSKLDKRFLGKEYFASARNASAGARRIGENIKVMVVGGGPCGLRTAIEMACLGSKVVVVEKRDVFSRNNVLHLWPFIITDLKMLGAKSFYPRFCRGAIDHISIRQLQLILLKFCLLLGVEFHVNISFERLLPPTVALDSNGVPTKGWSASLAPVDHRLSQFEFDVIIGADGKQNTLKGFTRREFRGKLAIGLTVNFINRHTTAEAKVEEISGVAYIFNQEFFKDLSRETGIDLENIVYYKGETHYFVMTAKKPSLLLKGVLKQDHDDTWSLLRSENIDRQALIRYTRDAADFSTRGQLPHLDFAVNQYGQEDVALFDFTCMYQAENAAHFEEQKGYKLLSCLVGDSLLEPFWPMGTGCARGFLAGYDATWMVRQWALTSNNFNHNNQQGWTDNGAELAVLAERESIYRLLHHTTPQSTCKSLAAYTIDPKTRYMNLNVNMVRIEQVGHLYVSDREPAEQPPRFLAPTPSAGAAPLENNRPRGSSATKSLTRKVSMLRGDKLLTWCQKITAGYDGVVIVDMASSWRSGLALAAIIHAFRPDLIDWKSLDPAAIEYNNQLAFSTAEKDLGISAVLTGKEMASCEEVDKLVICTYISQFYEMFKNEVPVRDAVAPPGGEEREEKSSKLSSTSPVGLLTRIHQRFKRRSYHIKHDTEQHQYKKKRHGSGIFSHKRKGSNSDSNHNSPSDNKENYRSLSEIGEETETTTARVGSSEVKLREKRARNPAEGDSSPSMSSGEVSKRASHRISALSNQLIQQWTGQQSQAAALSSAPSEDELKNMKSNACYFCKRQVYIVERLSAEGVFFHRQCFVCARCGITLRRGNYQFQPETGRFYCPAHFVDSSAAGSAERAKRAATDVDHRRPSLTDLQREGAKVRRVLSETGSDVMQPLMPQLSEEVMNEQNNLSHASRHADSADVTSDSSDDDDDDEEVFVDRLSEALRSDDDELCDTYFGDAPTSDDGRGNPPLDGSYVVPPVIKSDVTMTSSPCEAANEGFVHDPAEETKSSVFQTSSSSDGDSDRDEPAPDRESPKSESSSRLDDDTADMITKLSRVFETEAVTSSTSLPSSPVDRQHEVGRESPPTTEVRPPATDTAPADHVTSSTNHVAPFDRSTAPPGGAAEQEVSTSGVEREMIAATENGDDRSAVTSPPVTSSSHLRRFDTLDRVTQYLRDTPIHIEPRDRRDDDDDVTSVSSSTSSAASEDLNARMLEMLEEGENDDIHPASATAPPAAAPPRVDVSQGGANTTTAANDTSVWTNLEESSWIEYRVVRRLSSSNSSDLRPPPNRSSGLNRSVSSCSEQLHRRKPRHPVERKLSFDSVERRMKSRLNARKQWLRQERRRSEDHASAAEMSAVDESACDWSTSVDAGADRTSSRLQSRGSYDISARVPPTGRRASPPRHREMSPPVAAPRAHHNTSVESSTGDDSSFFTPRAPHRPTPSSDLSTTTFRDDSFSPDRTVGEYYSARETPTDTTPPTSFTRQLPAVPASTQPQPRRALPTLPKVPHLEALSPTGSPQSTLEKKRVDAELRAREARVRERMDRMREDDVTVEDHAYANVTPVDEDRPPGHDDAVDSSDWLGTPDAVEYSGKSPQPKRKFRDKWRKLHRKSPGKSSSGEKKKKRILPDPEKRKIVPDPSVIREVRFHLPSSRDNKKDKSRSGEVVEDAIHDMRAAGQKSRDSGESRVIGWCEDGASTLLRNYPDQSARDKAILRGERFRMLPRLPPAADHEDEDDDDDHDKSFDLDVKQSASHRRQAWAQSVYRGGGAGKNSFAGLTPTQIDAKITKRVRMAARKHAKLEAQKRFRRAQVIQRQLEEVEVKQRELEERGVRLEKVLRIKHVGADDEAQNMQQWFRMVQDKNALLRYENELMIYQRELQLEDLQSRLQQDLRERMAMDDSRKTSTQLSQEKEILRKMLEVVEQRDELVGLLDEQRLKEEDDEVDPETLMLSKFDSFAEPSHPNTVEIAPTSANVAR